LPAARQIIASRASKTPDENAERRVGGFPGTFFRCPASSMDLMTLFAVLQ
jgi:hypothetical protein